MASHIQCSYSFALTPEIAFPKFSTFTKRNRDIIIAIPDKLQRIFVQLDDLLFFIAGIWKTSDIFLESEGYMFEWIFAGCISKLVLDTFCIIKIFQFFGFPTYLMALRPTSLSS